ncbi:hypothetical protein GGR58DRAFT_473320 [Xylaria digitata]|nr:hypothetical protein GGR58DRAFT_473320 [Xylaria digitata]
MISPFRARESRVSIQLSIIIFADFAGLCKTDPWNAEIPRRLCLRHGYTPFHCDILWEMLVHEVASKVESILFCEALGSES